MAKETVCRNGCNAGRQLVVKQNGPHWGHFECPKCGAHMGWAVDPNKEPRKRPSKKLIAAHQKAGIDYCQLCFRRRDELPPGMTLEGHHIIEYQDCADNDPRNILQVCTFCHGLIALLRRNRMDRKDRPIEFVPWAE